MGKCEYLDLLINGTPLSSFNGSSLLNYSIGETPLTVDTFQGINRTSWNLLKSRFGLRSITITIVFRGKTLHEAKIQRSKFNSLAASGKVELYIPGDGFYYDAYVDSLGAEELVGADDSDAAIKSKYVFQGIRRDALRSDTFMAGDKLYCLSTMPYTDCRLISTLPDDPGLPTLNLSGASVSFSNPLGYYITEALSSSWRSLTGYDSVKITQQGGGLTRETDIPLGKTVYAGSLNIVTGELTDTHLQTVYDKANIPDRLYQLVAQNTDRIIATDAAAPYTFTSRIGEFPFPGVSFRAIHQRGSGTPSSSNVRAFESFEGLIITKPDGTVENVYIEDYTGNRTPIYGCRYSPMSGQLSVYRHYASYNGETLVGPWLSSKNAYSAGTTPTVGAEVLDLGAVTNYNGASEMFYEAYGSNTLSAELAGVVYYEPSGRDMLPLGFLGTVSATYYSGNLTSAGISTGSTGLTTGEPVIYPREAPEVTNVGRTAIALLAANTVTMTANTGNLTARLSTRLSYGVALGGAVFYAASWGDTIMFDGINGAVEINGVNAAATTDFLHFPSLVPGENTVSAQIGFVTVEYYPTYI